jgi:heparin binding hemagglutinin HbhA
MPITDDVRKYGETVREQGKVALEEVRKPWYAAVGAGELAYGQLHAQLSQLPTEVQARLHKLQDGGKQIDAAAVRSAVESAAETYAAQAKETYETLAHRGELVVRRLRRSPEVRSSFDKAEELVADAGKTVAKAEDAVTKPGPTTTRKPASKSAPAAKSEPAAKSTPAAKATPSTARKAPAKRTSTS